MSNIAGFGLLTIIFLPLWAVAFNLAGWRKFSRNFTGMLSTTGSVFCALVCWIIFFKAEAPARVVLGEWINFKNFTTGLELHLNPNVIYLLATAGTILALLHFLALHHLKRKANYKRFFIFLDLFAVLIFLLITTGDIFLLLATWMGLSLLSFISGGFNQSGKKRNWQKKIPFTLNITADIFLLLAVVIIASASGQSHLIGLKLPESLSLLLVGITLLISILLKSGQFPFHFWPPEMISLPMVILTSICVLQLPLLLVILHRFSFPGEEMLQLKYIFQSAGILSVIITGFLAASSKNYLKIIIYSTVNQTAWLLVGLGAGGAVVFHSVTIASANLLLIGGLMGTGIRKIKKTDIFASPSIHFLSLPGIFIILGALGISGLPAVVFQLPGARSRIGLYLLDQSPVLLLLLLPGIFLTGFYVFKIIFNFITTTSTDETTIYRFTPGLFVCLVGAAGILFINTAAYYFLPFPVKENLIVSNQVFQLVEFFILLTGLATAFVLYSTNFLKTEKNTYLFEKLKNFTVLLQQPDKIFNRYLVRPFKKICYLLEELVDKLIFAAIPALTAAAVETFAVCLNLVEIDCKREYDLKKILILLFFLFILTVWFAGA
ncbi:MAG: proton-conducting transporter membrane subunit [bacterium]